MDSVELRVLRKQTTQYIKDNPTSVTLTRGGTKTPDGAGGYTVAQGTTLDPQTVRLMPVGAGMMGGSVTSVNVDGEVVAPSYVMIAEHDADVKAGDTFQYNDALCEVNYVREDRRYETWCEVQSHG